MISHSSPSHEAPTPSTEGGPALQDGVEAAAVERFLRANPAFLASRPELYGAMEPPARVHGERMADHMHAILRAERARTAAALATLPHRRETAGMAARVQGAVLALMRAADKHECVQHELPDLLGLDAVRLLPGPLPPAAETALAGADAVVRTGTTTTRPLHAEAAPLATTEALVRVLLPAGPALLLLACRDPHRLPAHCGAELAFLGRAVSAAFAAP